MLWKILMIAPLKKHFHWSSPKNWMHPPLFLISQFRLVRCFTFFLLLHRPAHRALNKKSYWLIEMNIRRTLQAEALSLISLNLVYFGLSFLSFCWNIYQSAIIQRKLPCPDKFLVMHLYYNGLSTDCSTKESTHRFFRRAL